MPKTRAGARAPGWSASAKSTRSEARGQIGNVCLTFDFDAISVWIGNFHATSPSAISRGEFGVVGARRLLEMLREWQIPSTWFIPGHTADTYPEAVKQIAAAGHEI